MSPTDELVTDEAVTNGSVTGDASGPGHTATDGSPTRTANGNANGAAAATTTNGASGHATTTRAGAHLAVRSATGVATPAGERGPGVEADRPGALRPKAPERVATGERSRRRPRFRRIKAAAGLVVLIAVTAVLLAALVGAGALAVTVAVRRALLGA